MTQILTLSQRKVIFGVIFESLFLDPEKSFFESPKMSFLGPGSVAQQRFTTLERGDPKKRGVLLASPTESPRMRAGQQHKRALPQRACAQLTPQNENLFLVFRPPGHQCEMNSNPHLIGGKKVYTKGVFSSENSKCLNRQEKRFGVYQKACFQGKKKENTYTPKSLQGVCGERFRAALVYRFRPPI